MDKKVRITVISLFLTLMGMAQEVDLLIKGGRLIDPKNGIDALTDVAVKDGIIDFVGKDSKSLRPQKVIDANGLLVVPGLIDIHGHHFYGTLPFSYLSNGFQALPPDGFTFRSGITTTVDAGGAGWRNIRKFKEQVMDRSKTRVLAFLNIVGNGMKGGAVEQNLADMDARITAMVARQFKDHVVGIKLAHYNGYDWTPTERTAEAGRLANIPVMIDFGGSDPELSLNTLFHKKLRPGDIFTHAYAHVKGRTPIVDEDGNLRDYVLQAQKKGIMFDVGHGGGSFLFEQAVPAMKQGLWPNTISTDLHTGSMNGGMKDMLNVMSKFLNMDMPIQAVIDASTWQAAQVIKRPELGHLSKGAIADLTILQLQEGNFGFIDTQGKQMRGSKKLVCELTLKDGKVMYDLNGLASEPWNKQ